MTFVYIIPFVLQRQIATNLNDCQIHNLYIVILGKQGLQDYTASGSAEPYISSVHNLFWSL